MRPGLLPLTLVTLLLAHGGLQGQTTFSKRYNYGTFFGGDRSPDGHLFLTNGTYAFRMDAQGEELWHASVNTTGLDYTFGFVDIACMGDSGAILVGAATPTVPDPKGLYGSPQWVEVVLSSAGTAQWSAVQGLSFDDHLYFAEGLTDGTAVFGGMWYAIPGIFAKIKRAAFNPTDLAVGDCTCDEGYEMRGAHATTDGGYVAWGQPAFCFRVSADMAVSWDHQFDNFYMEAVAGGPGGVSYILGSGRLFKVAADGDLLWARHIEGMGEGRMTVRPSGEVLIAAGHRLMQCDSAGTLDWAREYIGQIHGLELTADGEGCYLYGSWQQQGWIALTDNMGLIEGCSVTDIEVLITDTTLNDLEMEQGCSFFTDSVLFGGSTPSISLHPVVQETVDCFSVQIARISSNAFSMAPMPVLDRMRVSFALPPPDGSQLELLNTQGQVLRRSPAGRLTSADIDRVDLSKGVYLLRLVQPGAPAICARVLFL